MRRLLPASTLVLLLAATLSAASATATLPWDPWSAEFGPAPSGFGMNGVVRALAVFDNALIAAGEFTDAGGVSCNRIARLSDSGWEPLGVGLGFDVYTLLVHEGHLYAGGESSTVRRWNGTTWSDLPSVPGASWIRSLHEHGGDLLAGVEYSAVARAFRWDGSGWQAMGMLDGSVRDFASLGSDLLALGAFSHAGGVPAEGVARWNGGDWEPFHTGAGSDFSGDVHTHTFYGSNLHIGGLFYTDWSEDLGYRLAVMGTVGWEAYPIEFPRTSNGGINAMTEYGGRLFIGGTFFQSFISGMSRLGPAGWESLGFPTRGLISIVFALQEFEGDLYVGGNFTEVDDKPSLYIGRYTAPATTAVPDDGAVHRLGLGAARPNPTRGPTTLGVDVHQPGPASLEVLDVGGRRVRFLELDRLEAGSHDVAWDGRDDRGVRAPAGIYFLRVRVGPANRAQKVVLTP